MFRESLLGVGLGHGDEVYPVTPLRDGQGNLPVRQFAEMFGQDLQVIGTNRQEDLLGEIGAMKVILIQHLGKQGLIVAIGIFKKIGAAAADDAAANKQDGNAYGGILSDQTEDILVFGVSGNNHLPLQGTAKGLDLVSDPCCFFKFQGIGRLLHLLLEPGHQIGIAAFQDHDDLLCVLPVSLADLRGGIDAGGQAVLHLPVETGPFAWMQGLAFAPSQREEGGDKLQGGPHG